MGSEKFQELLSDIHDGGPSHARTQWLTEANSVISHGSVGQPGSPCGKGRLCRELDPAACVGLWWDVWDSWAPVSVSYLRWSGRTCPQGAIPCV